ncbi:PTS transporter subunit EIIC [Clostridium sp. YIM B02506]|uniref:PTS transporter subunit EIIC n=1 Tax=Clostridium sp. YIM B02506 TaxID=2910680 RepID=UPI001EEF6A65|nr:PTS transporter subunit EIIC [Clostridium sp. YIM B02506]
MDHKKVATEVLKAVGGKENVNNLTHCVTRLRFKLKDEQIVKKEEVEKIDGVIQVIEKGGQYQVVIGNQVQSVYNEVAKLIGELNEAEDKNEKQGGIIDRITSTISGIFIPVLGVLAATGMLKGVLFALKVLNILPEVSGTYQVLYAVSDTLIYFFPIFLGSSAAKQFKINQYLGMAIGGAMIYPTIIDFVTKGEGISFLGLPMGLINYSSSVFPVIIAVWIASYLNKAVEKITPQAIKFFFVPLIVLVVMVPLTFFIVGPVLTYGSNLLSQVTMTLYNASPILAGLVIGGPWILIVMFGLHWAFIPIFINNFMTLHFDPINGLLGANQLAMAGAAIAIAIKTRDSKLKGLSYSTGIACALGVSEPVLYGVIIPAKKPLITSIIGGSIGGALAGFFGAKSFAFGVAGVFGIPGYINPAGIDSGFYGYVGSMVVGFVVAFILTYIWGYKNKTEA